MRCAPPTVAAAATGAGAAAGWPARQGREGSTAARPGPSAVADPESELDSLSSDGDAAERSGFADMWLFWRTRNRFSLEELRYLTEQLQKVHVVNEANKDFVIEALRSIAELMIYGDQHDPSFFEYFMEKQIMGEFARILRISKLSRVSLQLLQTMSIMIQNLRNEHSIYYIFSNEHINFLITYPFDFRIEEMLSYYISFLRAISGKLNKNTISLLVKTKNDEVTFFPLYVEALKFAFHEDRMIRVAIRTLTLNVYHVGDESVNRFVSRVPLSDYFSDMVQHFQKQCIDLDKLIVRSSRNADFFLPMASVEDAIVQIEDTLYYFSDVMSSGIPDLERFITENILEVLVFRLLLPSLQRQSIDLGISVTTSMYLLCCILHIFKNKDMSSTVAASLFHQPDYPDRKQGTPNGYSSEHDNCVTENECSSPTVEQSNNSKPDCSSPVFDDHLSPSDCCQGNTPREHLLSYITGGDDSQALGSLCLFATLLQTKELDESMLDALGILPQRKQHKKLLLQALVGEDLAERRLFSSSSGVTDDSICSDFDIYVRKLQDKYGLQCCHPRQMTSKVHRYQVLDALVTLFCRSNISADVRLVGGWLFRQLLPHGEDEFTAFHLRRLKDSHKDCSAKLSEESGGCWCDMLLPIVKEGWRNCKKAIEASSPPKGSKSIIAPLDSCSFGGDSSVAIAERIYEMVKLPKCQIQAIIDQVAGLLPGWKADMMTRAGRAVYVQFVLTAKLIYSAMAFDLPSWAIKAIDKLRKGFLWRGRKEANGGHCLLAWQKVSQPKELGGLGIHDLNILGWALRVRWPWLRKTEPDRPWAEFPIQVCNVVQNLFSVAVVTDIGDASNTLFWSDRWLWGKAIKEMAPSVFSLVPKRHVNRRLVSDALPNFRWLMDIQGALTFGVLAEFIELVEALEDVVLQPDTPDQHIWKLSSSGQYSTKSAYKAMFQGAHSPSSQLRGFGSLGHPENVVSSYGWLTMIGAGRRIGWLSGGSSGAGTSTQ